MSGEVIAATKAQLAMTESIINIEDVQQERVVGLNMLNNEIDCRNSTPQRIGTTEQQMEPNECGGDEKGFGTAPLPCKVSGDLASNLRIARIGDEEGLGTAPLPCKMPGDQAGKLKVGKIYNIIVDTSEEPTFNNEGDQECPGIVTKCVATRRKRGDRFGNFPDNFLVHESVKTVAKTQNVTCENVSYDGMMMNENRVGTALLLKHLTGDNVCNLNQNITLAAGQALTNPAKAELEKGEQVASVCDGLGTTANLANGLAKGVKIVSKMNAKKIIGVGSPRRQTATKKARNIGPEVASLTQELATKLRLGLDNNEVVVTELSNMNGMIGSPKTANFKSNKIISKVALPDWLIKWQKNSAL